MLPPNLEKQFVLYIYTHRHDTEQSRLGKKRHRPGACENTTFSLNPGHNNQHQGFLLKYVCRQIETSGQETLMLTQIDSRPHTVITSPFWSTKTSLSPPFSFTALMWGCVNMPQLAFTFWPLWQPLKMTKLFLLIMHKQYSAAFTVTLKPTGLWR